MFIQIPNISQIDTLEELLLLTTGLIQTMFFVTFVLMLMYAAYMYMISRGDEDKIVHARNIFVTSIAGFVLGVLAYPFSQILVSIFTGEPTL
jgi:hypothetical protein